MPQSRTASVNTHAMLLWWAGGLGEPHERTLCPRPQSAPQADRFRFTFLAALRLPTVAGRGYASCRLLRMVVVSLAALRSTSTRCSGANRKGARAGWIPF